LKIPDSSSSKPLRRVEESFERFVDARKESVQALAQVGCDIVELDEDFKSKKAQVSAASVTGNC
jgi:hypothetical protein